MNFVREHVFNNDRNLTDNDRRILDVYGQLDGRVSEHDSDRRVLRQDFLNDASACYVLSADENLAVGVARYKSRPDIGESYLQAIVIDEPYRRRKLGYGTMMIDFLMEQTKNDGNKLLSLDSHPNAVKFYADYGFIVRAYDPDFPEMIKHVS